MRNLLIHIHTDKEWGSHVAASTKSPNGEYHVYVDKTETNDYRIEPFAVVAHEIGHVLGFEFDLPKHREMSQAYMSYDLQRPPLADARRLDMNREVEAWTVARAMFRAETVGLSLHSMSHELRMQHEEQKNKFKTFLDLAR